MSTLDFHIAVCLDMPMEDTNEQHTWAPYVILTVVALIGVAFIVWISLGVEHRRELNYGFQGACTVLHGEVHDDLCVKDGEVVLTKADYKKEAK